MSIQMRHVLSLPIATVIRSKLVSCGFSTVEDFKHIADEEQLQNAANISAREATDVLKVIRPYLHDGSMKMASQQCVTEPRLGSRLTVKSVEHLLKRNLKTTRHIVSFSAEVDQLLGGGFTLGRITEIAGEAGLGKTQFCLQLCVDVQIPPCLGGIGGAAVYFDVEGTFFPQRLEQIVKASVRHCHCIANSSGNKDCIMSVNDFTLDKVMSNIYLFHCRNTVQLLSATHMMKEFLESHKNVKLLIVDSVAQCVRGDEDMRARTRFLIALGRMFRDLVTLFDIAIVLTNQVSTRITAHGSSCNIPALGTSWSHVASVKLMLHREGSVRYVRQYKHPSRPKGYARYKVTADGIRDHEIERQERDKSSTQENSSPRPEEDSSIPFYPITQGIANELIADFHAEDETLGKGSETEKRVWSSQIRAEEIPDKWLELSQRQLSRCDIDEPHGEHSLLQSPMSTGMLHTDNIHTAGCNLEENEPAEENNPLPPSPVLSYAGRVAPKDVCSNDPSKPRNSMGYDFGPSSPILQISSRFSQDINQAEIIDLPLTSVGQKSPVLSSPSSPILQLSGRFSQDIIRAKITDLPLTSVGQQSPVLSSPSPYNQKRKSPVLLNSEQFRSDPRPPSPVLKSTWQSSQKNSPESPIPIPSVRTRPPSPVLRSIGNIVASPQDSTSKLVERKPSQCHNRLAGLHSASPMSSGTSRKQRLRAKASATLRATVDTMLFSHSPVKAAPKKKQRRLSGDSSPKSAFVRHR